MAWVDPRLPRGYRPDEEGEAMPRLAAHDSAPARCFDIVEALLIPRLEAGPQKLKGNDAPSEGYFFFLPFSLRGDTGDEVDVVDAQDEDGTIPKATGTKKKRRKGNKRGRKKQQAGRKEAPTKTHRNKCHLGTNFGGEAFHGQRVSRGLTMASFFRVCGVGLRKTKCMRRRAARFTGAPR